MQGILPRHRPRIQPLGTYQSFRSYGSYLSDTQKKSQAAADKRISVKTFSFQLGKEGTPPEKIVITLDGDKILKVVMTGRNTPVPKIYHGWKGLEAILRFARKDGKDHKELAAIYNAGWRLWTAEVKKKKKESKHKIQNLRSRSVLIFLT